LHSNWVSWGARATFNLLGVFKYPAQKRLIKAKDEVLDARALAVTMAIMTQVHVSRVRYANSKKLYRTAAKHLHVQRGILKQIRSSHAEGQASEQTLIREEMNTLASQVSSDIAYADLQNSYANIFASMGIDPYTNELKANDSISGLASTLQNVWIERGDKSAHHKAKYSAKAAKAADASGHKKAVDNVTTGSINPLSPEGNGWKRLKDDGVVPLAAAPKAKKQGFFQKFMKGGSGNSTRDLHLER